MPLLVGTCVTDKRRNALQSLLEEVPDVLEEAIKACSAPRHAALDQDVANARDDYGKAMRRKWFGSKRGTVRHTFRDILAHITTKDVMINEHGGTATAQRTPTRLMIKKVTFSYA